MEGKSRCVKSREEFIHNNLDIFDQSILNCNFETKSIGRTRIMFLFSDSKFQEVRENTHRSIVDHSIEMRKKK